MFRLLPGSIKVYLRDFMVRFLIEFGHRSKSNGYWDSAKISSIPCLELDDLKWKLKSEHRSRVFSRAQGPRSLMGLANNMALRIEKRSLRGYDKQSGKTVHLGVGREQCGTEIAKLYINISINDGDAAHRSLFRKGLLSSCKVCILHIASLCQLLRGMPQPQSPQAQDTPFLGVAHIK